MSETLDRIETLEIKCAHLERAMQELSDVIYRQQLQIERLQAQIDGLRQHVEQTFVAAAAAGSPEDEVPPHY